MYVDVVLSPAESDLYDFSGKTAVVIDDFRFATTIQVALDACITAFFPEQEVEEAFRLQERTPSFLLAGERNALKVPGCDFGNSPLEHVGKEYGGGRLICTTTNGTRGLYSAAAAEEVVVASLRSAEAVARYIKDLGRDVIILAAGSAGRFSLEDVWCAGLILSYLPEAEFEDGALTARALYGEVGLAQVRNSAHGRILQSLGMEEELDFCLRLNESSRGVVWDPKTGWGVLES